MIKKSIKTFFQNLIYIFVPLGCLFLGLMFGAILLYRGLVTQFATLVRDVNGVLQDSQIRLDELIYAVVKSATELPWETPIKALMQIFSTGWLSERISEIVGVTTETVEDLAGGIIAAVQGALRGLIPYIVGFVVFLLIGLFVGFYITKFFVKRNSIKHKKFILWSLLESFVFLILFSLGAWLVALWKYSFYISIVVTILVFGFITLTEAYVSQPEKIFTFKQVVNVKNCFSLFLSYLILIVICGALLNVIYAVSNLLVAFSLGYPVICILAAVMSLTGKLYIDDLTERKARGKLDMKTEEERLPELQEAETQGLDAQESEIGEHEAQTPEIQG